MFSLSEAARRNLEAILDEFQRANRYYAPLYHQRLAPWSERGDVRIGESQWLTFIDAEAVTGDDEEWWQWDGPYVSRDDSRSLVLGRWIGDPGGLQEFTDLVESAVSVLSREYFSDTDDVSVPFSFGSFYGWLSTLHSWAFLFQMPLLRSDMTLWGVEDYDSNEFFGLAEQWGQLKGVSYPLHPVCWTLVDNVFTSSMTTIRAILEPYNVIATNEPWPDSAGCPHVQVEAEEEKGLAAYHCILETPHGWFIQPANSNERLYSTYQAGLHRMAVLIEHRQVTFKATDLAKYGSRRLRRVGRAALGGHVRGEMGIGESVSPNAGKPQHKDDEVTRKDVGEDLRELIDERNRAQANNDEATLERVRRDIEKITEGFHVTANGDVKSQRPFRDPQEKKAYDNVVATIRNAVADIKKQFPEIGGELEAQIPFPQLVFVPQKNCTPWRVVRKK